MSNSGKPLSLDGKTISEKVAKHRTQPLVSSLRTLRQKIYILVEKQEQPFFLLFFLILFPF